MEFVFQYQELQRGMVTPPRPPHINSRLATLKQENKKLEQSLQVKRY